MAGQQTITAVVAADARPFKKGMTDAGNSTDSFTKKLSGMTSKLGLAVGAMSAAAAFAVGDLFVQSLKAADQARQVSRGLEQAVKNSKAFGDNAPYITKVTDALDAQSRKLAELTGIDDEVISGIKRNWLAVETIAGLGIGGINKLAGVAADVAAGAGKDLESVANAFTKAYGDPKGAVAKLQKAGVVIGKQDKERYEALIAQGKQTEALTFLTDTLAIKYAGQAAAAASPFARMQVVIGNLMETIGSFFLPMLDTLASNLSTVLGDMQGDPAFLAAMKSAADSLAKAIPDMVKALPDFITFITDTLPLAVDGFTKVVDAVSIILKKLEEFKFPEWLGKFIDFVINYTPNLYTVAKLIEGIFGGGDKKVTLTQINQTSGAERAAASTNVNIKVSSVSSSVETGRAIANALSSFYSMSGYAGLKGKYPY